MEDETIDMEDDLKMTASEWEILMKVSIWEMTVSIQEMTLSIWEMPVSTWEMTISI